MSRETDRGRHYDIISEALEAYDEWMKDDDYNSTTALNKIMKQMRERLDMSDTPAQVTVEPLSAQAAREDERQACWKIADRERTALRNADPTKVAWLVAFDIANAIKARSCSLPPADRGGAA